MQICFDFISLFECVFFFSNVTLGSGVTIFMYYLPAIFPPLSHTNERKLRSSAGFKAAVPRLGIRAPPSNPKINLKWTHHDENNKQMQFVVM